MNRNSNIWFRESTNEWVYEYSIVYKHINMTARVACKQKFTLFIKGTIAQWKDRALSMFKK